MKENPCDYHFHSTSESRFAKKCTCNVLEGCRKFKLSENDYCCCTVKRSGDKPYSYDALPGNGISSRMPHVRNALVSIGLFLNNNTKLIDQ